MKGIGKEKKQCNHIHLFLPKINSNSNNTKNRKENQFLNNNSNQHIRPADIAQIAGLQTHFNVVFLPQTHLHNFLEHTF